MFAIINNFLTDPDRVREDALFLDYTKAKNTNWKGFRCINNSEVNMELMELIKDKLIQLDEKFVNAHLNCFFHYTLKEDTSIDNIHTDGIFDYAGVLYLTPNPAPDSGTAFYDENQNEINYVENVYNRLTIYEASKPHSLKESFGDSIDNGRLVYVIFIKLL